MATSNSKPVTKWIGWVYFAGAMMLLSGLFQGVVGLIALLNKEFYVITPDQLAVFNFVAWGWIHVALAVLLISAGVSVINGGVWGRVIGIFLVGLSLVANFVFIGAYPFWSIIVMLVDVLVLYALLVHGDEAREV